MSGATIQRQRGTYYELTLSTPSMNFAFDPHHQPGTPTYEQRYHAEAEARFRATLAPFDGPLDALLPGLAAAHPGVTLLALDDGLPQVQGRAEYSRKEHRAQRRGACRCAFMLRHTPDAPPGLDSPSLVLALAQLPEDGVLEPFLDAVTQEVYRLRREHLEREAEARAEAEVRAGAEVRRALATAAPVGPGRGRRLVLSVLVGVLLLAGGIWYATSR